MARGKTMRVITAVSAALVVSASAAPALAETGSVVRSLVLPGLGQAHDGHYARAAIFASAAVITWTGYFASQTNYSRTREKYENERRTYLYYDAQMSRGEVVRASDIAATYAAMEQAFAEADDDKKLRDIFIGAVAVTYAASLVDVLLSKPDSGEFSREPAVSLEWSGDGMRLVRTIRF